MEFTKQTIIQFLIIFVLVFLLLYRCDNKIDHISGETIVDTVKITHIDTTWFDSIKVRTLTYLDTVKVYEYPEDGSKVYRYVTDLEDSLIKGTIVTGIKLKDSTLTLLTQYLDYTPKFPKYINRTDSIIITKETFLDKPEKIKLAMGLNSVFGKDYYGIGPSIEVQFKDKVNINGGYDIVNKGVTFGLHIPILNNKK